MSEADIRRRILAAVKRDYPPSKGEVAIFGRPASASTGPGHPDLFGVALGHFFGLEVKTADGKPTPLQIDRIQMLRKALAYVWVVRNELAALKAVYQAKTGGRIPMADEPIDFDEWLKGLNGTDVAAQAEPAEEQVETVSPQEGEAPATEEARDFFDSLGGDEDLAAAASLPPSEELPQEAEGSYIPEPTPFDDVPVLLGVTEMPEQHSPEEMESVARATAIATEINSIQAQADADQNAATLQEDIRAVGDRVTLLWEQVGMLGSLTVMAINEIRQFRADFNKAMADDDEDVPEPVLLGPWKQPEVGNLGVAIQNEPPKRRGRRRAS